MTFALTSSPPQVVRADVRADLDVIDAALARLREHDTEAVGQAFRVEFAQRLETQERVNRGLMLRVFGELADPVDGTEDPALPAGVKVRDVLGARLRITSAEVKRRLRVAARLRPRLSPTGHLTPPELPLLAEAVATVRWVRITSWQCARHLMCCRKWSPTMTRRAPSRFWSGTPGCRTPRLWLRWARCWPTP